MVDLDGWQEMLTRCDTKSWVLEVRGCAWAELRVNGESLVIVHGLQATNALTLAHEAVTSLPALVAELRAARECIDVCETTFAVFGGFTGRTFPEADTAIAKYREATKGDR